MAEISLCMIVKNEAHNLPRCLGSAAGYVDEVIVVDTGSGDESREICQNFGAAVYDMEWHDNFAEARNYSLERATGDWILWLDADEELKMHDIGALKSLLQSVRDEILPVSMYHLYGPIPPELWRSHRHCGFRLFKNSSGIRFAGRIHEHLTRDGNGFGCETEPCGFLDIIHYGYMDSGSNEKSERNLRLLKTELKENGETPWINYCIAAEHYRLGDCDTALVFLNRSILGFLKKGALPPSLAYKLKYDILISLQRWADAYPGIDRAIALFSDYTDLHFYRGQILYALGRYCESAEAFAHCLVLGEGNPKHLTLTGTGSFMALCRLGDCYVKLQKPELARNCYERSQALCPQYPEASAALERLGYALPPEQISARL